MFSPKEQLHGSPSPRKFRNKKYSNMQQCTFYATFVGINAYPEGQLSGCISDVLDLDLLLREQCAQQKDVTFKPIYFLAPNAADKTRIGEYPTQLDYQAPTFDNITKQAFAHFKDAKKGDICLFYYSGHGSQIDAPEVFHYAKPDQQNETIVCVDSRDPSAPNARDIIDKELAYLIWQAFQGKESHNLVIMDCCHSGNNTRSLKNDSDVKFRYLSSSRNKVPFESYIGFGDTAFYTVKDGNAAFKIPRYVHLASCRDDEKAQETMNGGLFTVKLMEALRSGGTAKSYRNLVQSLAITVGNRADKQSPVAFSQDDNDLDQQFLSTSIIPYKPTFEVRGGKQWKMFGGTMHSLTTATTVRVTDGDITADVPLQQVFPTYSILDPTAMGAFDPDTESAKAIVLKVPEPLMKIAVAVKDPIPLKDAWHHPYFTLLFDEDPPGAQYIIQTLDDGKYVLFPINGTTPLFKREHDPATFLENVNKVGNWLNAVELKNTDPKYTKDDFIFDWEIIEGEKEVDDAKGEKKQQVEEITLKYKNEISPAFRLRISIKPNDKFNSCYIKALYLDCTYGITTNLIRDDNNQLEAGNGIPLSYTVGQETYVTLPVILDPTFALYNINEATDLIKIVVSDVKMNLDQYKQDTLELDDPTTTKSIGTRSLDLSRAGKTVEQPQWSVFTFKVKCVGPKREQTLKANTPVDFAGFTVEAPKGLSARAYAVTADDQQAAFEEVKTRSADVAPGFKPSANIWGETLMDSPFANIQALELFPEEEGGVLEITAPLIIRPNKPGTATRSLEDANLEEIIIPYGYDSNLQMYIPLGYADDQGNIFIEKLPPPSAGQLKASVVNTRSLGSSVKLFFKKIFRPKDVNTLAVYPLKDKKDLSAGGKAVLLVHGIIGDTKYMLEVFKEQAKDLDFILTYDYENLSTAVSDTAKTLHEKLQAIGFGKKQGMPELTIVAHSMGGLVSRWLIEKVGADYVKKLVLVGTPCGGSEMAKMGISAFGLLSQALNVTGPIKYCITGLSYLLKHFKLHPGTTLQELSPGSPLLQELSLSDMAKKVEYKLISGNTDLLKDYNGPDVFLKKIAASLKNKLLYPGLSFAIYEKEPNDMAVTLKSMQSIHQLDAVTQVQVVASNHLAYFEEGESLTQLMKLI